MKKTKTFAMMVAFIMISSMCIIGGCSRIDSGKIENVVGTYQLTKYTKSYVSDENKPEEDLLKDKQVSMYIVLTTPKIDKNTDNTVTAIGYLYYKDIETTAFCKEIKITYRLSYNAEQGVDEVQKFNYTTEENGENMRTLKIGWKDIGYLDREQALNVNEPFPSVFKKEYRENVYFKKVSDETDTSFIETKVGSVNAEKYLKNKLASFHLYNSLFYNISDEQYKQYLYIYIEISEDKQTATRICAIKDENTTDVKTTEEQMLPITYTISQDGTKYIGAKIGEIEYQIEGEQLIKIISDNSALVFDNYPTAKTKQELEAIENDYKLTIETQNS